MLLAEIVKHVPIIFMNPLSSGLVELVMKMFVHEGDSNSIVDPCESEFLKSTQNR